MAFASTGFLIFLLVGVIVYYLIPKRFQWIWLLILSYYFYLCSGVKTLGLIITTTVTTFLGGIILERVEDGRSAYFKAHKSEMTADEKKLYKNKTKKYKRLILVLVLLINFGMLAVIKYYGFAAENINALLSNVFHINVGLKRIDFLLPLGISFYTFQSMGYIIDMYQGKYKADRNIFKFALFVSYFPQILQGPIGRYNRLAHQFFERHSFELVRIQHGLQLMAWGFFKKMVLADRAAVVVTEVFRYVDLYDGATVLFGVLAYTLQLYADFSGGMDIVIGASEMFGITLDQNFKQPFFSSSISDFWHRWHITLGTWMKDYVFYPFSLSKAMSKFGKFTKKIFGTTVGRCLPICVANLLIFFIVGVWHGAQWKYIAYGMYNGLLIAASNLFEPLYPKIFKALHINPECRAWKLFRILRTFSLVVISFYFDVCESLYAALYMMRSTVTGFSLSTFTDGSLLKLGVDKQGMCIIFAGCVIWFIISLIKEKGIDVRAALDRKPWFIRWAVYGALVLSIPVFGKISETIGGFMYAQF